MTVVGARPQFIKAAAVSRAVSATPGVEEMIVHTGQHYDANMSDLFFEELNIPAPKLHLGVGSGPHGEQTGRMMAALETAILTEKPDWVLTYGDTNSTLAAALAASKLHVKIAHVEAGLRSFNRRMPEEINRVVTDHLSDMLFAPTQDAVENLAREGIAGGKVALVGDVMYDVALLVKQAVAGRTGMRDKLGLGDRAYIVATIHRAENTDEPARLKAIMDAFASVSSDAPVILPLHPRTRGKLAATGIEAPAGVILTEPLGYFDLSELVTGAKLVVTDSGGLQKEAFFHGVPCLTLRDETEWVELVALGWNRIVPPVSKGAILAELNAALAAPRPAPPSSSPYGDGTSANRIVEALAGA